MRVWIAPLRFERGADRADAAVHHVAGRDDVDAGLGLHQRLLRQHGHGVVVDDVAAVVEQAVLAVAGEGVERDVGEHARVRGSASSARAPRAAPGRRGWWLRGRRASSAPARSPGTAPSPARPAPRIPRPRRQPVEAAPLHAGHAGHVLRLPLPSSTNTGRIRSCGGQPVLAHQRAGEGVAAQAARAAGGKGRGCQQGRRP